MKFRIDRSKWRCGGESSHAKGLGTTRLLNDKGFMCCLGHVERQLGLSEIEIQGKYYPQVTHIKNILCKKFQMDGYVQYYDSELSQRAIKINDNSDITTKKREKLLIDLFKEYGHELEFYNNIIDYEPEIEENPNLPI